MADIVWLFLAAEFRPHAAFGSPAFADAPASDVNPAFTGFHFLRSHTALITKVDVDASGKAVFLEFTGHWDHARDFDLPDV